MPARPPVATACGMTGPRLRRGGSGQPQPQAHFLTNGLMGPGAHSSQRGDAGSRAACHRGAEGDGAVCQAAPGLGFSWAWAEGWRPVGDVFKMAQQPHLTSVQAGPLPHPQALREHKHHSYTPAALLEGDAVVERCLACVV